MSILRFRAKPLPHTAPATEHSSLLPESPGPTLSSLPPELHLMISSHLTYPDALSLKHTSRHFYRLVDTGVRLKVDWLMERRRLHLECPNDKRCDLGSDLRFCRGSVPLLMKRRRQHIECESRPGLGCLVLGTRTCPHARRLDVRVRRWLDRSVLGSSLSSASFSGFADGMLVFLLIGFVLGGCLGVWVWEVVVSHLGSLYRAVDSE